MTNAELSNLAIEILADEPAEHQNDLAGSLLNNCRTTTQALKALQNALRDQVGDEAGALLLAGIISAMAVHEAETI